MANLFSKDKQIVHFTSYPPPRTLTRHVQMTPAMTTELL